MFLRTDGEGIGVGVGTGWGWLGESTLRTSCELRLEDGQNE